MSRYLFGLALCPGVAAPFYLSKDVSDEDRQRFYHFLLSYSLGFAIALFCTYVIPLRHCPSNPFLSHMVERRKEMNKRYGISNADLAYGLENLWFNADLEPQTLWVNLGYWEKATHPTEACADLFRKLLDVSGITSEQGFSIIEVGCGCAETAQVLLKEYQDKCANWVGLTLSALQVESADTRLKAVQEESSKGSNNNNNNTKCQIFEADAARPETWSSEVQDSVSSLPSRPWLVGVDALNDFPSRKELLAHARQELGASVALTEHLRVDPSSTLDSLKLWGSFRLLDTPLSHVLTKKQYLDLLVECGYKEENISFIPYTEHVYAPYSRFISQQGRRWQEMGGSKWDYMDFSLVGFVTDWWARSGLVQAYMIVARP